MKSKNWLMAVVCLLVFQLSAFAGAADYQTPQPLSNVVKARVGQVDASATIPVPTITWGGDVATVLTEMDDIFKDEGLNVSLFREDNFPKQVEKCLSGDTPYIRGTMGMINAAAEAFKAKGLDLTVVYQLTWSVGGDALVVRQGKTLDNVQTVALQLYGPHMDYAANLFQSKGRLNDVTFKWLPELTLPDYDSGKIVDPVSAFQADPTLDAVMCIIPDALMLTSGGTVGTGAEGSVKGAEILVSTKTAGRIIADVYAVRTDYFQAHRGKVQKFVRALMRGEEALRDLVKNKSTQQSKYRQLLSKSADLLLGASQATADAEALLGDCEFVGHEGNMAFFTGKGTLRNMKTLNGEIGGYFSSLGLLGGSIALTAAGWDYAILGQGLKYGAKGLVPAPVKPKFDTQKAMAHVESRIAIEPETWEDEGTLFMVEIYFNPNQNAFSASQYTADFQKALEISQTYNGALIVVEGHSDPLGVLKAERKGELRQVLNEMRQSAKNLSLERSQKVREAFLSFCVNKGINIDESQFLPIGLGVSAPKYSPPQTEAEWNANRRVVFRIKQMEAEMDSFVPLD